MNKRIRLDTAVAARTELERCSTGLTVLDHAFTNARISLDAAEELWEEYEAQASEDVRTEDDSKSITAKEINGRIARWVKANEAAQKARQDLREARRNLDLLDRWYRSLEKRSSAAQSAMKQHDSEQRNAGFVGETNFGGGRR